MFFPIKQRGDSRCGITGFSHTGLGDDARFNLVSQKEFIQRLSDKGREELFGHPSPYSENEIQERAEKCISQTGITNRLFFDGPIQDLALIAARKCLANAKIHAAALDAIIVATNTGTGYPSVADYVKGGLNGCQNAMCFDVAEACTAGSVAIFLGANLIHNGLNNVLVIAAEKATQLARRDDWKASNLFADAAGAMLLSFQREKESFIFFDMISMPYGKSLQAIYKRDDGYFMQDGPTVHKFVGREVVASLAESLIRADIEPSMVKHIVTHQPSGKTMDLLENSIKKMWPNFSGMYHRDKQTGNTSSASTLSLISKLVQSGEILRDEIVLVSTFGAGLSIGNYAFRL